MRRSQCLVAPRSAQREKAKNTVGGGTGFNCSLLEELYYTVGIDYKIACVNDFNAQCEPFTVPA